MTRIALLLEKLLRTILMMPPKPSPDKATESDGEPHGVTKPVGDTLKTKTLKLVTYL